MKTCTVIGFPLGTTTTQTKMLETVRALQDGANELDMVLNIGELRSGHEKVVLHDIKTVSDVAHEAGALMKVIIETCLLTDDEKVRACQLAVEGGTDFVKTSTGFSDAGAKIYDVTLMKKIVGVDIGVKASGGIHTLQEAQDMITAGADRIGASASVAILKGYIENK